MRLIVSDLHYISPTIFVYYTQKSSGGFCNPPELSWGFAIPSKEYQLFKQHCIRNDAGHKRTEQHAIVGITIDRAIDHIVLDIGNI